MKRLITILLAIICVSSCGSCGGEYIELSGRPNLPGDAAYIKLDDGWFAVHSEITINYKDSVMIIPLVYEDTHSEVKIIR